MCTHNKRVLIYFSIIDQTSKQKSSKVYKILTSFQTISTNTVLTNYADKLLCFSRDSLIAAKCVLWGFFAVFLHYLIKKKHGQFNEFCQFRHQGKLMIRAMGISFTPKSSFFNEKCIFILLSSPTLYTLLNNVWITLHILKLYLNKSTAYPHTRSYIQTHNSLYLCNYLKFFMYASNIHSFLKL